MGDACVRCGENMSGQRILFCWACRDEDPTIEAAERGALAAAWDEAEYDEYLRHMPPPPAVNPSLKEDDERF